MTEKMLLSLDTVRWVGSLQGEIQEFIDCDTFNSRRATAAEQPSETRWIVAKCQHPQICQLWSDRGFQIWFWFLTLANFG